MSAKEITDRQGQKFAFTTCNGHNMFREVQEKFLPRGLEARFEELKKLKMREDDIMICTFPKTGTHWIWEIVSMVKKGKAEYETNTKTASMIDFIPVEMLDALPSPRILNSHFGIWVLPDEMKTQKTKIIHLMRNPKDVAVSFFYHGKAFSWVFGEPKPCETFPEFLPYITGEYGVHNYVSMFRYYREMEKFEAEYPDLILNLYFEDLIKDTPAVISKVAKFLNKTLSPDLIQAIADKCSFQNLKNASESLKQEKDVVKAELTQSESSERKALGRPTVFRKGIIGDWKNHFTVAENEQFDRILKEEFKDSRLKFTYTVEDCMPKMLQTE